MPVPACLACSSPQSVLWDVASLLDFLTSAHESEGQQIGLVLPSPQLEPGKSGVRPKQQPVLKPLLVCHMNLAHSNPPYFFSSTTFYSLFASLPYPIIFCVFFFSYPIQ